MLVLVPGPSFPGCVQEVRPIGLLEMLDQGVLDEKVLAVGKNNPRYNNVWNYTDIYPHMLKEITHFFSIYKDLEGKRVEIKGWHDAAYARDHVLHSVKQFRRKQGEEGRGQAVGSEDQACEVVRMFRKKTTGRVLRRGLFHLERIIFGDARPEARKGRKPARRLLSAAVGLALHRHVMRGCNLPNHVEMRGNYLLALGRSIFYR